MDYDGFVKPLALRRLKNGKYKLTRRCRNELRAIGWCINKKGANYGHKR